MKPGHLEIDQLELHTILIPVIVIIIIVSGCIIYLVKRRQSKNVSETEASNMNSSLPDRNISVQKPMALRNDANEMFY